MAHKQQFANPCAKSKKPDTKGCIILIHLYGNNEKSKHKETNKISGCQGLGVGVRDSLERSTRQLFGMMEMFCILTVVVATGLYMFVKIHITLNTYKGRILLYVNMLQQSCLRKKGMKEVRSREKGRKPAILWSLIQIK